MEHVESGAFEINRTGTTQGVKAQCIVIESGDLCYSKLRPYLDKAFIANFDAVCSTELLVYQAKESVSLDYILNIIHSDTFIHAMSNAGYGTKMPRVSDKIIGNFPIKLLDPETEREILGTLRMIVNAKAEIESRKVSSSRLLKSLINQIF